jgi:hypothetical protein
MIVKPSPPPPVDQVHASVFAHSDARWPAGCPIQFFSSKGFRTDLQISVRQGVAFRGHVSHARERPPQPFTNNLYVIFRRRCGDRATKDVLLAFMPCHVRQQQCGQCRLAVKRTAVATSRA